MKKNRAFTLIEVLVVSTIIGVLVTVAAVSFANSQKRSRDARRKADLQTVLQALVLYRQDNGDYGNVDNMIAWQTRWTNVIVRLKAEGYLTMDTIIDPKGGDGYQAFCTSNSGPNCQSVRLTARQMETQGDYVIFTP